MKTVKIYILHELNKNYDDQGGMPRLPILPVLLRAAGEAGTKRDYPLKNYKAPDVIHLQKRDSDDANKIRTKFLTPYILKCSHGR